MLLDWSVLIAMSVAAVGSDATTRIDVDERLPILVVTMSPRGVVPPVSTSRVLGAFETALSVRTTMGLRTAEQTGVDVQKLDACPLDERLACWSRVVRDADDELRRLMVVSIVVVESGQVELSAITVDLDHAAKAAKQPSTSDRIENVIFERTEDQNSGSFEARDIDTVVDKLVEANHRLLTRHDRGDLRLLTDRSGLAIQLDGRDVGVTTVGTVHLVGLDAGSRAVALFDPVTQNVVVTRTAKVPGAGVVNIDVRFEPRRGPATTLHRNLTWVGVGVGAAGLVIASLSLTVDRPRSTIIDADGRTRTRSYFPGTCNLSASTDCKARGPLLFPSGLALLAAGGLSAAGFGLLAEDDSFEWWWAVGSALVGVLTYGVLLAADSSPP